MIKRLSLVSFSVLIFSHSAVADEIEVSSKVERVTLFQQQAEITRLARAAVPAGRHTVVFEDVPQSINPDSLQVAGKGSAAASIEGVEFKTVHLQEDFSKESQAIEEKIRTLESELKLIERTRERIESQRKSLQQISLEVSIPAEGDKVIRPRNAKEMGEVLNFSTEALNRLDAESRSADDKADTLSRQLDVLKKELSQRRPRSRTKSVVEVSLTAPQSTDMTLELTYQIGSAAWSPAYNVNVSEEKNSASFTLETFGLISQRTGEDWENVNLTLSTARPQISLQRPQPQPRILDVPPPVMPMAEGLARRKENRMLQSMARSADTMEMVGAAAAPEPAIDGVEFGQTAADLTVSAGVVSYRIPGTVTLKSDGSQEKIKVAAAKLEGKILNVAVPALTQHVYREATIKNTSGAPILPGPVNMLSGGKFTGKQTIAFTQRDKEIKLPVGVSEEVLATRKLVKKFEEDPGIVRSYRKISSSFAIELENLASSARQLAVLEPEVISRNDKIKVSRTGEEPRSIALDNEKRLYKDTGVTEWQVELKAGEKKTLTYEVTAEFPADLQVSGLEGF